MAFSHLQFSQTRQCSAPPKCSAIAITAFVRKIRRSRENKPQRIYAEWQTVREHVPSDRAPGGAAPPDDTGRVPEAAGIEKEREGRCGRRR